nr:small heat shock protein [Spinther sp. ID3]
MSLTPFDRHVPMTRGVDWFFRQPSVGLDNHSTMSPLIDPHITFRDQFRAMEQQMRSMELAMNSTFADMSHRGYPQLTLPHSIEHPFDAPILPTTTDPRTGERHLALKFDMHQFAPEEIMINTKDNLLTVTGKHEKTGAGGNHSYREYKRAILLPENTQLDKLHSSLSRDGVLSVEGPLPALPAPEKGEEVSSRAAHTPMAITHQ